jgi:Zn-dependent peptidase ImmA (M78 family)
MKKVEISIRSINLKRRASGVPILSKDDIDGIAEILIHDFQPELLESPQSTPVEDFAELYLELSIDYQNLSNDNSVLGMITFNDGYVEVYDENKRKNLIEVKEGTVFIDNSLMEQGQNGRYRFTYGHEPGHWIFHRDKYRMYKGQMTLFELLDAQEMHSISRSCFKKDIGHISRRDGGFSTDEDWMEWQADYFSSALLMPKKTYKMVSNEYMAANKMDRDYFLKDVTKQIFMDLLLFTENLANIYEVSQQAAAVRLYKFGYISQGLLSIILNKDRYIN